MAHDIQCWKCGASLEYLPLPFGRQECCKTCGADLHACKLCREYDPRATQQCLEPTVEEVRDKERANFCGHYAPVTGAFKGGDKSAVNAALTELEKLFGKR